MKPIEREIIDALIRELAAAREWKHIENVFAALKNVRAVVDARISKERESALADEMRRMQNRT